MIGLPQVVSWILFRSDKALALVKTACYCTAMYLFSSIKQHLDSAPRQVREVSILLFYSQMVPAFIVFCSCLLSLKLIDFVVFLCLFIPNAIVFGVLGYKFLIGRMWARKWLRGLTISSIVSVVATCFFDPNIVLTYDANGLCNMLMFIFFSIATQLLGRPEVRQYGLSKHYQTLYRFMHDLALLTSVHPHQQQIAKPIQKLN